MSLLSLAFQQNPSVDNDSRAMAFGLTFSHEALAKAKKRLVGGNSANSKLVLLQYLGRVHGWVGDETTNATIVPRFLLVNTVVSMESQCRFTAGELDRTKHTTHSDFSVN